MGGWIIWTVRDYGNKRTERKKESKKRKKKMTENKKKMCRDNTVDYKHQMSTQEVGKNYRHNRKIRNNKT